MIRTGKKPGEWALTKREEPNQLLDESKPTLKEEVGVIRRSRAASAPGCMNCPIKYGS